MNEGQEMHFIRILIWIIDGTRRQTDETQFTKTVLSSKAVRLGGSFIVQISDPDRCRLLKEWKSNNVAVFIDFQESKHSRIWFMPPVSLRGEVYLMPYSIKEFITLNKEEGIARVGEYFIKSYPKIVSKTKTKKSSKNEESWTPQKALTTPPIPQPYPTHKPN